MLTALIGAADSSKPLGLARAGGEKRPSYLHIYLPTGCRGEGGTEDQREDQRRGQYVQRDAE